MLKFPNAKLNLGLRILNKRPDGFHNIESVFYPVNYCDALEIIPSESFSFETDSDILPKNNWDNLCVKAYELLKVDFDLPPVKIFLQKKIPIGAGLGGGSADAAVTLKLLNELFDLKLLDIQLEKYAAQLGSDCMFFIKNKPALVTGRGEELQAIDVDLANCFIVITTPSVSVNTASAYKAWDEMFGSIQRKMETPLAELIKLPLHEWKNTLENDFEKIIFNDFTGLAVIKAILYEAGALYSALSGSGSSLFAIFGSEPKLEMIRNKLSEKGIIIQLFCIKK